MFTQVIIWKRKTDGRIDGRTIDGRTDSHTDAQRETIILSHFRVAGYKKVREKSRACHYHKLQPFPDTKKNQKPLFQCCKDSR